VETVLFKVLQESNVMTATHPTATRAWPCVKMQSAAMASSETEQTRMVFRMKNVMTETPQAKTDAATRVSANTAETAYCNKVLAKNVMTETV